MFKKTALVAGLLGGVLFLNAAQATTTQLRKPVFVIGCTKALPQRDLLCRQLQQGFARSLPGHVVRVTSHQEQAQTARFGVVISVSDTAPAYDEFRFLLIWRDSAAEVAMKDVVFSEPDAILLPQNSGNFMRTLLQSAPRFAHYLKRNS